MSRCKFCSKEATHHYKEYPGSDCCEEHVPAMSRHIANITHRSLWDDMKSDVDSLYNDVADAVFPWRW